MRQFIFRSCKADARRARQRCRALLAAAAILTWAQSAQSVERAKLDRTIVAPGDFVSLVAETNSKRVSWVLQDIGGRAVKSGTLDAHGGRVQARMPFANPGYFELVLRDEGSTEETRLAAAAVSPVERWDARFGVMTHFAQGWSLDLIPLIGRIGVSEVRDELYWSAVEKSRGIYRIPTPFRAYMDALRRAQIRPLIVLSFENPLYDQGLTPFSEEGRRAFTNYALYIANTFSEQVDAVEVWNEYNGSFCKGPCATDRPKYYNSMLRDTYTELKRAHPDLTVLGASTVLVPLPYLDRLFRFGALMNLDAVSIHPYRSQPEGVENDITALRHLMQDFGAEKPIWVTETGVHLEGEARRTEVARYLVKMYTILLSEGVQRIYWYLFQDYAEFVGMGLTRRADDPKGSLAPTPAYVAYATLIRTLGQSQFERRYKTDPRTHAYSFQRGGERRHVIWTRDPDVPLQLVTSSPLKRIGLDGVTQEFQPVSGVVEYSAGPEPAFWEGPIRDVRERRSDALLANSQYDFSLASPGQWSYRADPIARRGGEKRTLNVIPKSDQWGGFLGIEADNAFRIDAKTMHPTQRAGQSVAAVRSWTSPDGADAVLSGRVIRSSSKGDGTGFQLLCDGKVLLDLVLGGSNSPLEKTFAYRVPLSKGSRIEAVVTPGPGVDIDFDAVEVELSIARKL